MAPLLPPSFPVYSWQCRSSFILFDPLSLPPPPPYSQRRCLPFALSLGRAASPSPPPPRPSCSSNRGFRTYLDTSNGGRGCGSCRRGERDASWHPLDIFCSYDRQVHFLFTSHDRQGPLVGSIFLVSSSSSADLPSYPGPGLGQCHRWEILSSLAPRTSLSNYFLFSFHSS